MNHAPVAESIARPVDQRATTVPWMTPCPPHPILVVLQYAAYYQDRFDIWTFYLIQKRYALMLVVRGLLISVCYSNFLVHLQYRHDNNVCTECTGMVLIVHLLQRI